MLRNRHRQDMMAGGYDPGMQPSQPPVSKLDPKDERLLELSQIVGQLQTECEMLNEDNRRLERDNAELKGSNKILSERNTELETEAAADKAGYTSATDLIEEIREKLKEEK